MKERAKQFYTQIKKRRSVRRFSKQPIPQEVIDYCLKAAGTSPSGANQQPWHFVVVKNQKKKKQIREKAEEVEKKFYKKQAPKEFLEALEPLKTKWEKPFLENAPYLIIIFAKKYRISSNGEKSKNYYVSRSVGIATGILITALHHVGLSMLPYTPSSMGFLRTLLDRPENEWPFLVLVVGFPSKKAEIPNISKKSLEKITTYYK